MKAIRDPVHNIIYFDSDHERLLLDLIDTAEFQRLRHINQLGLSSYTYPGATHTRFAHSLGVAYLMKRFIERLLDLKDESIKKYQKQLKDNKLLALVAALLHDIGHGPFSHAIESVTNVNHEKFSMEIITGNTEINFILERHSTGFSEEVMNVIRRTHELGVIVKLLSSQLDVDRIDYLIRDSKMTGAKYGIFDLEWLINVLRIGIYRDEIQIGLDLEKGLSIAEDFVMARYYMYKHVYFHKATRNVELFIKNILQRAIELDKSEEINLHPDLKNVILNTHRNFGADVVSSFLNLTDNTLWNHIYEWRNHSDSILENLCRGLLQRKLYKSIPGPKKPHDLVSFYKKAHRISSEENIDEGYVFNIDNPSTSSYKDIYISEKPKGKESESEKEASEQIILFDSHGSGYELSTQSNIIKQIKNEKLEITRLYFPETYEKYLLEG